MNNWITTNAINSDDNAKGFVYVITCDHRYYIGKKLFNRGWEKYTGSSNELNVLINNKYPYKKFILFYGQSKSELNYVELYLQMYAEVLFDKKSYNGILHARISKRHLNEEFKYKIRDGLMDILENHFEGIYNKEIR